MLYIEIERQDVVQVSGKLCSGSSLSIFTVPSCPIAISSVVVKSAIVSRIDSRCSRWL